MSKKVEVKKQEVKKNQEAKKVNKKVEEKKMTFLEKLIKDEKLKASNYESIHKKYKDKEEISFIDSIEKIKIGNSLMKTFFSKKEALDQFNENYEFIMIHRESRKIYYLFLYDKKNDKEIFIMKNNSIMKNKIYLLKFSQFFEVDSLKIHYIKSDRKNQSSEIIDRNSKEYAEKIKKYSMI